MRNSFFAFSYNSGNAGLDPNLDKAGKQDHFNDLMKMYGLTGRQGSKLEEANEYHEGQARIQSVKFKQAFKQADDKNSGFQ